MGELSLCNSTHGTKNDDFPSYNKPQLFLVSFYHIHIIEWVKRSFLQKIIAYKQVIHVGFIAISKMTQSSNTFCALPLIFLFHLHTSAIATATTSA